MHPAAGTKRVGPANPRVKADQRTGPKSSAAPTTLLAILKKKKKKLHLLIFWAAVIAEQWQDTERVI